MLKQFPGDASPHWDQWKHADIVDETNQPQLDDELDRVQRHQITPLMQLQLNQPTSEKEDADRYIATYRLEIYSLCFRWAATSLKELLAK